MTHVGDSGDHPEATYPLATECGCFACVGDKPSYPGSPLTVGMSMVIVCPKCGNKRCPHGTDHRNECTASNDPGQTGSRYGGIDLPPVVGDERCERCENHDPRDRRDHGHLTSRFAPVVGDDEREALAPPRRLYEYLDAAGPLAGHFCGQAQPHAAHQWSTPPLYGATHIITNYQCAGLAARRTDVAAAQAAALREAADEVGPALQSEVGGHTSTYSVRQWLRARADRLAPTEDGEQG